MTVNVIDLALHTAAFPSTYTGPGNLIGNPSESVGEVVSISGYFTGAGNVTNIPVGFQPKHIQIVDETDVIVWEWFRGMAATHVLKTVTVGTLTVDATSAITVNTDLAGNCTISLSAALAASGSNLIYKIDA